VKRLKNKDSDDPRDWVTIQIDSRVFDADRGSEAVIREIVDTVGQKGKPGERVRCIVSVSMLSEGWDVKSVSHILGLRAFGSPLLTEQVIGRGLRRTDYDVLNQPIGERPPGSDETVDAFGIPFVGFPVERRKRQKTGSWNAEKPVPIEPDPKKVRFAVRVPNVRAWAVGVTGSLSQAVNVDQLPGLAIDSRITPPNVHVKPVVGGQPEEVLTLEEFRNEWPLLKGEFMLAQELFEATNPDIDQSLGVGPTFEDLLDLVRRYVALKVVAEGEALRQDLGMVFWRHKALNILENGVRNATRVGTRPVPIPGDPEVLDSRQLRKFHWTGILAAGKRCHTTRVPCHTDLEKRFADFLDRAEEVVRYFKNERFGFSVTYYENQRPRQYFPDFIVAVADTEGREAFWLAETKGEIRPNTAYKQLAAETWCQRMTLAGEGRWRYLFLPQKRLEDAFGDGVSSFAGLVAAITQGLPRRQLELVALRDERVDRERFKTLLPLYSLRAAAGAFGSGEGVEPAGWVHATEISKLDPRMFVVQAVGHSMEPTIHDGDYVVFRFAPKGSRQGKVVLAQYRGAADPDTGGAYTVKRFESQKTYGPNDDWRHAAITLRPDNPAYQSIEIAASGAEDFRIVAEFVAVLKSTNRD
jgi:phage repressor protein C with HTH and peptisase S24 domain